MVQRHQDDDVGTLLQMLDDQRRSCEGEGNYAHAETALSRIKGLAKHEWKKKMESLRLKQSAQRFDVEQAQLLEMQQFNWASKQQITQFEKRSERLLQLAKQRQASILHGIQDKYNSALLSSPKASKKLLNLRSIERRLAKLKEYREATKVKREADELEKHECSVFRKNLRERFLLIEEKQMKVQQKAVNAVIQRIKDARKNLEVQRQRELQLILQRDQNTRKDLHAFQHRELVREKALARPYSSKKTFSRRRPNLGKRPATGRRQRMALPTSRQPGLS